jgi:hypothetical protein
MRKALVIATFASTFVLLAVSGSHAVESLVLYDDFSGSLIDPDRWYGSEASANPGATESVRHIQNRALHLIHRVWSAQTSNDSVTFGANNLNFARPDLVTAMKARVQIKKVMVRDCTAQSLGTGISARLHGIFFNTGTPTAGSSLGDVVANIRIHQQGALGQLEVFGRVSECADPACNTTICVHPGCVGDTSTVSLGNIRTGQATSLRIQWDPDMQQFLFQRDNQPEVPISYAGKSDASPPSFVSRQLRIAANVPNCLPVPGAGRPVAFMEAFFDNVGVNQSAAP